MEQKRTLILVIGALSAAQMAIARTADTMMGMYQHSRRLAAKMDEIVVAELECRCCPDLPPPANTECAPFEAEMHFNMQWPDFSRREMELALMPRELPKLAELEPRRQHEQPVFRGYMNGRDTWRKRW